MKTLILKILPLLLTVVWAGSIHAQPINTTALSVTSCPGEIAVPVNVTNCNGIGAISLVLNFDNTKLTYLGYQNLNSALTVGLLIINAPGNKVVISWANTTAANLGNSTMVELRFNAISSTTSLTWDTQTQGNCEYSDVNGNILPSTFTNGTATINQPPVVTVQPTDKTVLVGQNTTFSFTATGTGIAYLWQVSTDGGGIWMDLVNNATYSNVTGTTLYIYNVLLAYNGYKYRCRLTGTCTPVAYTNGVTLTVIDPITTTLPTASSCPMNIIVPVTVTNFTGVAAFSLVFSYNTNNMTYLGFQNLNGALAGGTFVANPSGGKVYMTWSSTTPATIGNGTLVEFQFAAATGTSSLEWDVLNEGNCEYTALSGDQITSVFVNGNETIFGLPAVIVHPVNKTIAKGQNTTFSVTATGSGLTYLWQVSTNGGVDFTNLTNGGYYSNVMTNTLTITGAQLALNGYQYRCIVSGTCTPFVYSNAAILTVLPNVITTCGTATGCPGEMIIPVNVTDFIGIASFSMTLAYNSSVLTFTGSQNLNAALAGGSFVANATAGKVYLTWSGTTAVTLPGAALLVEVKFNGVPGASTLNWDTQTPGNCEYSDLNGQVIFSTWNNGSATINIPPSITTHPVNRTIYATGSTTFTVAATGTGLGYLWQISDNGGANWSNLSNIPPYSGALTSTLTINPASTGMNGYLYRCIVSGTCTPSDTSNSAQLTVTQAAISTSPGTVTNSCTGNLDIPVNLVNCLNVGSISLTMTFDTTKMSFEGYHSVNIELNGGFLVVNRSANKVILSWASITAANIGNGVLIHYRFKANAGISTTLTWDTQTPGACEYADPNGTIITSFYNTSNISIQANALIVDAGPDMIKSGSSVQLDGSATGGTLPYAWLWSPAGSLNDPAIPNPLASPAVTTTYTLTVTANNGCSGSDLMDVIIVEPPQNLVLQDITIPNGASNCYDALQTITVAGGGTTFIVQNGGSAIMIAGLKINYLPGTRVFAGGSLHGYITTNGQYCNALLAPQVLSLDEIIPVVPVDGSMFRIFPNPTTGRFTLELKDDHSTGNAFVTVYSPYGERIFGAELTAGLYQDFSLSEKPTGLYFVRVVKGEKAFTKKLLKQ